MSRKKTSNRRTKLRSLFVRVLKGESTIDNRNAALFLEAICDQDDRTLCVQKLQASEHGRAAFRSAISSSIDITFQQESITKLLLYLSTPELKALCGGTVLQQMILSFVEAELEWEAFVTAFKSGQLTGDGEMAFSWLLLQVLSLSKEKVASFVALMQNDSIQKRLQESNVQEVRLRAQKIAYIATNLTASSAFQSERLDGPGGRHDNDSADISKICILPTADELSTKDPYLPQAHETSALALQPGGLTYHLDAQFRLLREDMLGDLKEEIRMAPNMQKGQRRSLSIEHLTMAGVQCDGRTRWAIQFLCKNGLSPMPNGSEAARRQFLKDRPKFYGYQCAKVKQCVALLVLVRFSFLPRVSWCRD